jgi:hypothetical protein
MTSKIIQFAIESYKRAVNGCIQRLSRFGFFTVSTLIYSTMVQHANNSTPWQPDSDRSLRKINSTLSLLEFYRGRHTTLLLESTIMVATFLAAAWFFTIFVYFLCGGLRTRFVDDVYEDRPPSTGPRYHFNAEGFARELKQPLTLRQKFGHTYTYDDVKLELERLGLDNEPHQMWRLTMAPDFHPEQSSLSRRQLEALRQEQAESDEEPEGGWFW